MFIAFVVRHSSEICHDHVLVSQLEGQVFQAWQSCCGSGNRFSSYGGKGKRLWDSIKVRTVYLQKFCCIYHQIKTGTLPSTLKSYYLVTLEIRLEDLDLRSLDIKIRNTDLLQEIISCKKIISICGLVLRRKI